MPNTDKTILLPQLQRYDERIKNWANNKFIAQSDAPSIPEATETTLGAVYASVNSSAPNFLPLGTVASQKSEGLVISSINDGAIKSSHLADGAVTADKIAKRAITADKLAIGVGGENLIAGNAVSSRGGNIDFWPWIITISKVSNEHAYFTINTFYNSKILIISDIQCSQVSNITLTVEHNKGGINRSGFIAFNSDGIDSYWSAEEGANTAQTNVASTNYYFAGLFFTVQS